VEYAFKFLLVIPE